jgi:hypothetical protein
MNNGREEWRKGWIGKEPVMEPAGLEVAQNEKLDSPCGCLKHRNPQRVAVERVRR